MVSRVPFPGNSDLIALLWGQELVIFNKHAQ